jgi:uncharacterized membrane protein (Fun14 family)
MTWQVVVASRVLPACLLAIAVSVPAAVWSRLPPSRPGPLLVAVVPAVIGVFVTAPQVLRPVVMDPEPFLGPLTTGFLPGLAVGFVRTKFGRLALGVFFLSEAAARTVGLTVVNAGASTWQSPLLLLIAGSAASVIVAATTSLTLRRFGRTRPAVITASSYERRTEDSV